MTCNAADARRHLVKIGAGNYIFAFQMLFLHLKRESSLPNLLTLWECMWACEDLLAQEQRRCEPLVCRQQTSPAAAHGVPETLLTPPSAAVAESITEPQQPVALVCVNDGQEREGITGSKQPSAREAAREEDQQQPLAAGTAVEATVVGIPAARVYLCVYVVAAALRRERKALLACGSMEEVLQSMTRSIFTRSARAAPGGSSNVEVQRSAVSATCAFSLIAFGPCCGCRKTWPRDPK
ncbi:hypothetical protein Vretifemale_5962 [Volvox reticuliferus]|uniref:Rab-GAP TBC domain-containing protein n=1 Tax=Volvox reticuliferus TaxID=1737510 RepID=A0A8J4FM21_9CHLO|nr:hypothetical protein Vretifemale_5962 [Volvox reticuliferus]